MAGAPCGRLDLSPYVQRLARVSPLTCGSPSTTLSSTVTAPIAQTRCRPGPVARSVPPRTGIAAPITGTRCAVTGRTPVATTGPTEVGSGDRSPTLRNPAPSTVRTRKQALLTDPWVMFDLGAWVAERRGRAWRGR